MSRILARVLGGSAGPEPVLPRLPTPFEPGLELAGGPGPLADEPDAAGRPGPAAGDRAVRAVSATIRPAGSWPEPPPAAPGVRPVPGDQPAGAPAPARRSWRAEPSGPTQAGSPRPGPPWPGDRWPGDQWPGDQWPAHPVRAGWAVLEPPGPRAHPAGRAADPAAPLRPADPAPMAAARAEPAGRRGLTARRVRPGGLGPDGLGAGGLGAGGLGSDGLGSDGLGSDGLGSDGLGPGGLGPGGLGPGGLGYDGLGPDPSLAAGRLASRRAARLVRGPAPDEPVVHITIGQVEIRAAASSPAPAARPAARPRRAAPDLSEYLQRRGRPR